MYNLNLKLAVIYVLINMKTEAKQTSDEAALNRI